MPDQHDRVEREIEEILRKIDDFPTEAARVRAQRKKANHGPSLGERVARQLSRVTASQLTLIGIALVLGSYFIVARIQPTIGTYGIIAGLILFFSSFVLSMRPAGPPRTEKRWRGRVIDTQPPGRRAWFRAWRPRRR